MKMKIVSKFLAAGLVMLAVGETCTYAQRVIGVNYGPYHKPGQTPERPDDPPITDDQFQKDLKTIVDRFGWIRTYGTEKRVQGLLPFIAKNFPDLNVYLGIFESTDWHAATKDQINTAIQLATKYPKIVEYIIVGNECLDQDWKDSTQSVSIEQLIADINDVKSRLKAANVTNVKVTTCLGFHSALNPEKLEDGISLNPMYNKPGKVPAHGQLDYGKRIMKESQADSLMFTVYPFFGKVPVEKAKDNTKYWYDYAVKNIANGKPVILGEVGWPSAGKPDNGDAIASVENERIYTTDIVNAVKDGQIGSTFLFEAFDEPWKPGSQWEPHWGLWDQNGNPKFPIPSGM
jgi:exo-beta-1,3-glucanase (GH17 family)